MRVRLKDVLNVCYIGYEGSASNLSMFFSGERLCSWLGSKHGNWVTEIICIMAFF